MQTKKNELYEKLLILAENVPNYALQETIQYHIDENQLAWKECGFFRNTGGRNEWIML